MEKKKKEKKRIDKVLLKKGIARSRERITEMIKRGSVVVNGKTISKPSYGVKKGDRVRVKHKDFPWVSRGGLKLEKLLQKWKLNVRGCVCVDVGASRGGFTHVLLKYGAKRVYAVDVGKGQLAKEIKERKEVVSLEGTDFRELEIEEKADLICIDASHISLTLLLSKAKKILKENGVLIALVKPQFELGGISNTKKGVVKKRESQEFALKKVKEFAERTEFKVKDLQESPVKGKKGNKEFFLLLD